jgi:long-chain acyl-CoA synthetase
MDRSTPLSAFYSQVDKNPASVALISGRHIWSFRRLAVAVEQVAQALHARGVRRGDRVALHMFNVAELAIAYYSCFRLGAIAAPLNTRCKTAELRAALRRLKPSVYIGQDSLYHLVVPIETDILPADACYIVGETSVLGQSRPWESLLESSAAGAILEPPNVDAPAVLLATSGTTGESKFVTHTAATLAAATQACGLPDFERAQIAINTLPLVHASGFFVLLTGLRFGAIQVLIERIDADAVLDAIERYYGTWLVGLPSMFVELVRRQRARPRKVDSLEYCATVGDVCPLKVQREFPGVFGVHLRAVWAATDVVGAIDRRSVMTPLHDDAAQWIRATG